VRRRTALAAALVLGLVGPAAAGPDPQPCQKDGDEITFRFPLRSGRLSLDVDGDGVLEVKLNGQLQNCGGATNAEIDQVLVMAAPLPGRNVVIMRVAQPRRPRFVRLDLGGGKDTFAVRGGGGRDVVAAGTGKGNRKTTVVHLDKDGTPDVEFRGVEVLRADTGGGNDEVTGIPTVPATDKAPTASLETSLRPARARMVVRGGGGNDRLTGGKASDRLFGGPGNDKLDGGKGKDRCNGGPGKDTEKSCEK